MFFQVKQSITLDTVPEFYKLFESGNLSHGKERRFILEVMRDGVQHHQDYELGRKVHAWELIMSLFGSPLSNPATDTLIADVFLRASRVPFVGRRLVKANGFFTWLTYQLTVCDSPETIGSLVMSAAHCMRDLLHGQAPIPVRRGMRRETAPASRHSGHCTGDGCGIAASVPVGPSPLLAFK